MKTLIKNYKKRRGLLHLIVILTIVAITVVGCKNKSTVAASLTAEEPSTIFPVDEPTPTETIPNINYNKGLNQFLGLYFESKLYYNDDGSSFKYTAEIIDSTYKFDSGLVIQVPYLIFKGYENGKEFVREYMGGNANKNANGQYVHRLMGNDWMDARFTEEGYLYIKPLKEIYESEITLALQTKK